MIDVKVARHYAVKYVQTTDQLAVANFHVTEEAILEAARVGGFDVVTSVVAGTQHHVATLLRHNGFQVRVFPRDRDDEKVAIYISWGFPTTAKEQ